MRNILILLLIIIGVAYLFWNNGFDVAMKARETINGTWTDKSGARGNYIKIYSVPFYNTGPDGRQVLAGTKTRSIWFRQPEFKPEEKVEGEWCQGSTNPYNLADLIYSFDFGMRSKERVGAQMQIDVVNRDLIVIHGSVMANGAKGLHELSKIQKKLTRIAESKSST